MLESLVRVAQAHARLMARSQVGLQDAVVAVWLQEAACVDSQSAAAAHAAAAAADAQSFPDDPDAQYGRLQEAVVGAVMGGGDGGAPPDCYLEY